MERRPWMMAVAAAVVCSGLALFLVGEMVWTTGVDAFFGQVNLTRESGSTDARAYVSNELLPGRINSSEFVEAYLIPLRQEVYFWDPAYVGFARASLTSEEALQVLERMTSGNLFTSPHGRQVECAQRIPGAEAELAACEDGPQWQAIHQEIRLTAQLDPGMNALQFRFPYGRLAEFRLYSSGGLLAFSAVEVNELPVDGYVLAPADTLPSVAARAVVAPVSVLWPQQTSEEANAHAARLVGGRYERALAFLRDLQPLRQIVGEMVDLRPAQGENRSSTWMDSLELKLTLRVTGEWGEAVVMIRGSDCWDAEMMYQGMWNDLASGPVCPES